VRQTGSRLDQSVVIKFRGPSCPPCAAARVGGRPEHSQNRQKKKKMKRGQPPMPRYSNPGYLARDALARALPEGHVPRAPLPPGQSPLEAFHHSGPGVAGGASGANQRVWRGAAPATGDQQRPLDRATARQGRNDRTRSSFTTAEEPTTRLIAPACPSCTCLSRRPSPSSGRRPRLIVPS